MVTYLVSIVTPRSAREMMLINLYSYTMVGTWPAVFGYSHEEYDDEASIKDRSV